MFYWIMKHIVVGPILLAIFRPWVVGLQNVPKDCLLYTSPSPRD